jgi:hypothetical protein
MAQEATPPAPAEGQEPAATPPSEGQEPKGETPKPSGFDALPPETQAEIKKLRAEAAAARVRLQEHEDAQKSELEKAQTKAQRAEQKAQEAEAKLLRHEVAAEKNLPAKLASFLSGSREEMEAQAAVLLEEAKPAAPDFDGGTREPAPPPKTPEQRANEVALRALGINTQ